MRLFARPSDGSLRRGYWPCLLALCAVWWAATPVLAQEHAAPAAEGVHAAAEGEHGAAEGEHAAEAEAEPSPLATEHGSWFLPLARAINGALGVDLVSGYVLVGWFVGLLLVVLSAVATASIRRHPDPKATPPGLQNFFEFTVEGLANFTEGIIGPGGRKFTPLIATYFLFILLNNWIAVIPGFVAPTSTLNMTLALGGTAFLAVQFYAVKANGLKGYLLHFAGSPQDLLGWALAPLMFVLEIIGELVKPLSLSMRLCGNIFGEDTVVIQIAALVLGLGGWHFAHHHFIQGSSWLPALFPVQLPFMAFSLFGGLIQALVFSMLVCIYISLLTSHEDEGHGHGHGHEEVAAH